MKSNNISNFSSCPYSTLNNRYSRITISFLRNNRMKPNKITFSIRFLTNILTLMIKPNDVVEEIVYDATKSELFYVELLSFVKKTYSVGKKFLLVQLCLLIFYLYRIYYPDPYTIVLYLISLCLTLDIYIFSCFISYVINLKQTLRKLCFKKN